MLNMIEAVNMVLCWWKTHLNRFLLLKILYGYDVLEILCSSIQ